MCSSDLGRVVSSCVVLNDSGDSVYMKRVLHLEAGPNSSRGLGRAHAQWTRGGADARVALAFGACVAGSSSRNARLISTNTAQSAAKSQIIASPPRGRSFRAT